MNTNDALPPACARVRDLLSRFLDDDLPARAATGVIAHLDACADCRSAAEALRGLRAGLQKLAAPPDGDAVRARAFTRLERAARGAEPARRPHPARPVWRPAVATLAAVTIVLGALVLAPPTPAPDADAAPLGPAEMATLFDLHDVHGAALSGDEPILGRDRVAEAHAALLARSDAAVAGGL